MSERFAVVMVAVVMVATACSAGSSDDASEVFGKVADSVVLVENGVINGSGFVVDDGYVVTNQHVVGLSPTALVAVPGAEEFVQVDVVAIDVALDIAVLGPIEDPPRALEWADTDGIEAGEALWAVGYPGKRGPAADPHISPGVLAQRHGMALYDRSYLQFSESTAGGQSGGVLVDADGKVVGVTTLQLTEARFLNALLAEDVAAAVDRLIADGGDDLVGERFTSVAAIEVEPQGQVAFRVLVDEATDIEVTASSRLDLWLEVFDPAGFSIGGSDDPAIDHFDPSPRRDDFENQFYVDAGTTGEERLEATLPLPGAYFVHVGTFSRFGAASVEFESNVEVEEVRIVRDGDHGLELGVVADGMLLGGGDSELWRFDVEQGESYRVRVDGVDPMLAVVRDEDEDLVASASFSHGRTVGFTLDFEFQAAVSGIYEIEIGPGSPLPLSPVAYRVVIDAA